jgi:hypothetical protein
MKLSDEMPSYEECFICGDLTGRAGQGEDSLYCDECDKGPYCPDCFRKHHESDVKVTQLEEEKEQQAQTIMDCQKRIAQLLCQLEDDLLT